MKPVVRAASGVVCAVVLAFLALPAGLAAAKPAYVPTALNLRAAPGTTNEVVAKIPGGSLVDVGACTDNWCAVTWQDKQGFSIQSGLDTSGRVPVRRSVRHTVRGGYVPVDGPVYYEEPPIYVAPPPPAYYYPYRYRRYWGRPHYWGPRWHFSWGW
jgi:uncharacterized protein YraI